MFKSKNEDQWKKNYILEYNEMRNEYEKIINEIKVRYEEKLAAKQNEIDRLKKEIKEKDIAKLSLKPKEKQISDKDINKIKKLRKNGMSYREIERSTKWSKATISRVLNGLYDFA